MSNFAEVCNPENAHDFSALAYFFAESLTKILNVPVGIIDCSDDGSDGVIMQAMTMMPSVPVRPKTRRLSYYENFFRN